MVEHVHDPLGEIPDRSLLVTIYRPDAGPIPYGTTFLTPNWAAQQVGLIRRESGVTIPPHIHKRNTRTVENTAEVLFVIRGRIEIDVYTDRKTFVKRTGAKAGEVVVLYQGGHSLTFLDNSEVIEIKQGPYLGRDNDKEEFTPE